MKIAIYTGTLDAYTTDVVYLKTYTIDSDEHLKEIWQFCARFVAMGQRTISKLLVIDPITGEVLESFTKEAPVKTKIVINKLDPAKKKKDVNIVWQEVGLFNTVGPDEVVMNTVLGTV